MNDATEAPWSDADSSAINDYKQHKTSSSSCNCTEPHDSCCYSASNNTNSSGSTKHHRRHVTALNLMTHAVTVPLTIQTAAAAQNIIVVI